jgi:hypothetical protein
MHALIYTNTSNKKYLQHEDMTSFTPPYTAPEDIHYPPRIFICGELCRDKRRHIGLRNGFRCTLLHARNIVDRSGAGVRSTNRINVRMLRFVHLAHRRGVHRIEVHTSCNHAIECRRPRQRVTCFITMCYKQTRAFMYLPSPNKNLDSAKSLRHCSCVWCPL